MELVRLGLLCCLPLLVCLFRCLNTSQGTENVRTFSYKVLSRESSDNVWLMMMVEETFSYLNMSKINSVEVHKKGECGFACLTEPLCFSYNLAASATKTGTRVCELLPSDRYQNSDKFNVSQRFHHYSIRSHCSSGPCQNGGKCVSQYDTDSYVCACAIGFTGKDCQTKIDYCKNDTCLNDGTCINYAYGSDCLCPLGFYGFRCEYEMGINSTILSNDGFFHDRLSYFLAPAVGKSSRWLLCYRASMHDWAATTFHTRCDHKNHTVTIIKNDQYVFGGYTDIPWDSSDTYGVTTNAFIFSLRNKESRTFKSKVLSPEKAIYKSPSYGPIYGGGPDILITDNANSNNHSFTNFSIGGYYELTRRIQDPKTVLAGTYHFSPNDWEVFYLG